MACIMMHVPMKVHTTRTPLQGLLIVTIDYFKDDRGFFMESWNRTAFAEAGITDDFVQDSHSASRHGVVRGMHYQDTTAPMAKLVRCTAGRIMDVAVDLRMSSPTFGQSFNIELTAENKTLVYVPVGFAHGFATMADHCEVQYKQSGFYNPAAEGGIIWNDPDIAVPWPYLNPVLSAKDSRLPTLADYRKKPAFPD